MGANKIRNWRWTSKHRVLLVFVSALMMSYAGLVKCISRVKSSVPLSSSSAPSTVLLRTTTTTAGKLPEIVSIGFPDNGSGSNHSDYDYNPSNAIVYMAQKKHQVYNRDSYGLLLQSLDLLFENYLLIDHHYRNVTVFVFHTGDFDRNDLVTIQQRYPAHARHVLVLVNLFGTPFWQTPTHLQKEDPTTWALPEFNIGYRHMIRWYAVLIWRYFQQLNNKQQRPRRSSYRYIMRMDEESFFHSPIRYDLFGRMASRGYRYAFRMCSYEMNAVKQIYHNYTTAARQDFGEEWAGQRSFHGGNCGFYNNWFIGSLEFFTSKGPSHMLRWFDQKGVMYRDRVNDLIIQTALVYTYAKPHEIHRFLDWSYEHFTLDARGCPKWGALQGGYDDQHIANRIEAYLKGLPSECPSVLRMATGQEAAKKQKNPPVSQLAVGDIPLEDLSPTYNHVPAKRRISFVRTLRIGRMELMGRGERSG